MSTIQIQKYVGAFLVAMLLALGANFIAQVVYRGGAHGEEGEPVFLVGGAEPAAEAEPAPAKSVVEAIKRAGEEARAEAEPAATVETGVGAEPAAAAEAPVEVAAADPEAGAKLFRKCAACHSVEAGARHKIGPNLAGVVGADIARHGDFSYSGALSGLEGSWDQAKLDAFLTDPKGYAPGTKMAFPGLADAADRAAVIAYLGTLGE